MKTKLINLIVVLFIINISACTQIHRNSDEKLLISDGINRLNSIRENKTLFTDSLACYGRLIRKNWPEMASQMDAYRVGISTIRDKTGKVYPLQSTALSDMVVNAMAKVNLWNVLDYEDLDMFTNLNQSYINYVTASSGTENARLLAQTPEILAKIPKGIIFTPQMHISGALTEYNERNDSGLNAELKYVGLGYNVKVIDLALDLRFITSYDGAINRGSDRFNDKANSISVSNQIITVNVDADYFRLIKGDNYGLDFAYQVSDPKYYAIRELIEYGILSLMTSLTRVEWKDVCPIEQASLKSVYDLKNLKIHRDKKQINDM